MENVPAGTGINIALSFYYKLAGALALLSMIWGSFLVMTAAGNRNQIRFGQYIFKKAIVGLLLILCSVSIVRIIAWNVLRIPAFNPNPIKTLPQK